MFVDKLDIRSGACASVRVLLLCVFCLCVCGGGGGSTGVWMTGGQGRLMMMTGTCSWESGAAPCLQHTQPRLFFLIKS